MEFDGLVVAGTFAEVTEIPEGCNIVDAKWLYKWKGDSHGMVGRCETHKETVTFTTPIALKSAGARSQHRCAPGKIGELAEAHTGSKRQ